jgi:YNFM family putative membrane transporter
LPGLFAKITGLAIFTFGFFGTHSTACSWTGKSCTTDKAQGSALYMLFYYMGSSVIGTIGGLFLSHYNWPGLIMLITIILGGALLSANLVVSEEFSN